MNVIDAVGHTIIVTKDEVEHLYATNRFNDEMKQRPESLLLLRYPEAPENIAIDNNTPQMRVCFYDVGFQATEAGAQW